MVRAAADGRPRSTKVFDSEFAFYGPVGFDLGLAYANYVIAAARAFALGEDERAAWALGLLDDVKETAPQAAENVRVGFSDAKYQGPAAASGG